MINHATIMRALHPSASDRSSTRYASSVRDLKYLSLDGFLFLVHPFNVPNLTLLFHPWTMSHSFGLELFLATEKYEGTWSFYGRSRNKDERIECVKAVLTQMYVIFANLVSLSEI